LGLLHQLRLPAPIRVGLGVRCSITRCGGGTSGITVQRCCGAFISCTMSTATSTPRPRSDRRDVAVGPVPRRAGTTARRGSTRAHAVAVSHPRLNPLPSLEPAPPRECRAATRPLDRHTTHARHPPLRLPRGDRQQLVEPSSPGGIGSTAP